MPSSDAMLTRSFEIPIVAPYRLDLAVGMLRRLSSNIVDLLTPESGYVLSVRGPSDSVATPDAKIILHETGYFALETHAAEIGSAMVEFLGRCSEV